MFWRRKQAQDELTVDDLKRYYTERLTDITAAIDSGRIGTAHAEVLMIRRNLYRNLIEIIERGSIEQ